MRRPVMVVAGLLGALSVIAGLPHAGAQPFHAESAADEEPRGPDGTGGPHHMQGWAHGHGLWWQTGLPLGLVFTAPDRQLSQTDVQKIAEAYLLWHGNHDWRVTNLVTDGDRVTFSIATAQNAVIASFAMDRHTGALTRTG